ncbi:MAG TPA: hypothetical protein VFQ39_20165 [Longimicrobium sp.]|nr:hypothetical protein [Longimicrobium sp.]
MAGKTVSAHADDETARLIEHFARVEGRSPSQIAAAALALYVRLPAEAHSALRHIQSVGTADDLAEVTRRMTRQLLNSQFEIGRRAVVDTMQVDHPERLETEEDILAEAVRLTSPDSSSSRRRKAG